MPTKLIAACGSPLSTFHLCHRPHICNYLLYCGQFRKPIKCSSEQIKTLFFLRKQNHNYCYICVNIYTRYWATIVRKHNALHFVFEWIRTEASGLGLRQFRMPILSPSRPHRLWSLPATLTAECRELVSRVTYFDVLCKQEIRLSVSERTFHTHITLVPVPTSFFKLV